MGYKKLKRFAAIREFPHVLEYPQGMAGSWHTFFHNDHPLVLELACGKGEYTLGLAMLHPGVNCIGVDVKGNRIWVGASIALEAQMTNVAFIRTQIELLSTYFSPGEVREIWITFPDPQLNLSRAKKRLTHPRFLRLYNDILSPDGIVHLKTDSPDLYRFTLEVIRLYDLPLYTSIGDVYGIKDIPPELQIRTHYEGLDIARAGKVHYLKFGLNGKLSSDDKAAQLKQYIEATECPRTMTAFPS
jgi:tRNA (guanine-N7-)-methyltransferase